jgi:hypothetical protein
MSLTKNLYREDEVVAALKWCLMRGRRDEAIFWLEECMDSGMHAQVLESLLWAWCFSCGPSALPWLGMLHLRIQEGVTEEHLYELTHVLLQYRLTYPDSTAFVLLAKGLSHKGAAHSAPDYITRAAATPLEAALLQGKAELAWYIARPLWAKCPWSRLLPAAPWVQQLETITEWFPVWNVEMTWPVRAVAIAAAAAAARGVTPVAPFTIPEPTNRDAPMRARRLYTIPVECLYMFTARGSMRSNETTDSDLTHRLEACMCGSHFWDEYLATGLEGTPLQREGFYAAFFPNDIPDEWSLEDRAKSHGPGFIGAHLEGDCAIINSRCLERWFGLVPSRTIWNGAAEALEILKEQWLLEPISSFAEGFHTAYTEKMGDWEVAMENWTFPVCLRELVDMAVATSAHS